MIHLPTDLFYSITSGYLTKRGCILSEKLNLKKFCKFVLKLLDFNKDIKDAMHYINTKEC